MGLKVSIRKKNTKIKESSYQSQSSSLEITNPECINDRLSGWICESTTVLQFFNVLTKIGTTLNFDINHTISRNNWTPLHLVCDGQNYAIAKALIHAGASINPKNAGTNTPLNMALNNDHFRLVKLLVDHGGITYHGVSKYLEESIERLENLKIDDGILKDNILSIRNYLIDHSIKDLVNNPPYDQYREALKNGDIDVVRQMLETNRIHVDECSDSPVRIAVLNNQLNMVKLLVQYGALIIEDNIEGITSAMYARKFGYTEIAEFLEETQRQRYQYLKSIAELPQKYELFMFGLFSDKKSILHTELGKQSDIGHEVVRRMISFEFS